MSSQLIDAGMLGHQLRARAVGFQRDARRIKGTAAAVATAKSREVYTSALGPRPYVPPRPQRPTTQGGFASTIQWTATPGRDQVGIDIDAMEDAYGGRKVWLINEIGTGTTAQQRVGGTGDVRGRHKRGNRSVKAQTGRLIGKKRTGGGLRFSGPFPGQVEVGFGTKVRIRAEIKPKHFVRRGAAQGFRAYERDLLTAARKAFRRPRP